MSQPPSILWGHIWTTHHFPWNLSVTVPRLGSHGVHASHSLGMLSAHPLSFPSAGDCHLLLQEELRGEDRAATVSGPELRRDRTGRGAEYPGWFRSANQRPDARTWGPEGAGQPTCAPLPAHTRLESPGEENAVNGPAGGSQGNRAWVGG